MKNIQDIKDNKKLVKNIEEYNRLLKKQEEFVADQKRNGFRNVEREELIQRCLALHLAEIKKLQKGKKMEQPLPISNDLHQRFSTWGTRTPGGTRAACRGYAKFQIN